MALTPLQGSPSELSGAVLGPDSTYYALSYHSPSATSPIIEKISGQGSVAELHAFSPLDAAGHNADGSPDINGLDQLHFNSDGNLYGITDSGGAYGLGTLYTLTPGGAFTTLLSFNFQAPADTEFNAVLQGADGAYYGIIQASGAGPQFYKVSKDGVFTPICTLPLPASHRAIKLAAAADGSLYGLMGQNIGTEVIRLTASCGMTQLYAVAPSGNAQMWDMALAGDGNLYLTLAGDENKIVKLTPSGAASEVYVFPADLVYTYIPGYWSCARPQWPRGCTWVPALGWVEAPVSINVAGTFPTALVQGRDGNLYGTTGVQGLHSFGTIFRLTLDGSYSTLFATESIDANSPLMQDAAGNITFFSGVPPGPTSLARLGSTTPLTTGAAFSPATVNLWQPTELSWSSTGAQTCSLITDIPGLPASKSVAVSGSQTVRFYSKGLRTPAQYTAGVECTAADGSISNATTNVTIN